MRTMQMKECPICTIKQFVAGKKEAKKKAQMRWWYHVRACFQKAGRADEFKVTPRLPKSTPKKAGESKHVCHTCGATFDTVNDRVSHQRQAHVDLWRPLATSRFHCSICGVTCSTRANLARHTQRVHPIAKDTFMCHICGKTTATKEESCAHTWTHRKEKMQSAKKEKSVKNETVVCNDCDATFDTPAQLRAHSWVHVPPKKGKEWGDKDAVRAALQSIAAVRLERLPFESRIAICLPGDRPEHETELMKDPGFKDIHMVECMSEKASVWQRIRDRNLARQSQSLAHRKAQELAESRGTAHHRHQDHVEKARQRTGPVLPALHT